MLNEFEVGVRSLMDFPSADVFQTPSQAEWPDPVSLSTLLKQWEGRLQFTQVSPAVHHIYDP